MKKRGGKVLAPSPKSGVCRGIDQERDQAIKDIGLLGGDLVGRSLWGKLSGYSRRALVETTFSRYKRMFGGRFFSRKDDRIMVENRLKCLLLKRCCRLLDIEGPRKRLPPIQFIFSTQPKRV